VAKERAQKAGGVIKEVGQHRIGPRTGCVTIGGGSHKARKDRETCSRTVGPGGARTGNRKTDRGGLQSSGRQVGPGRGGGVGREETIDGQPDHAMVRETHRGGFW